MAFLKVSCTYGKTSVAFLKSSPEIRLNKTMPFSYLFFLTVAPPDPPVGTGVGGYVATGTHGDKG